MKRFSLVSDWADSCDGRRVSTCCQYSRCEGLVCGMCYYTALTGDKQSGAEQGNIKRRYLYKAALPYKTSVVSNVFFFRYWTS